MFIFLSRIFSFFSKKSVRGSATKRKLSEFEQAWRRCRELKAKMSQVQAEAIVSNSYPDARVEPINNYYVIVSKTLPLSGWHQTENEAWKEAAMRITRDSPFTAK